MKSKLAQMQRWIALVTAITGAASGGVLEVKQKYQEQSQWCWAATCQSALEFYGIAQSQTTIANYGTGGANVWNYLWGADTHDGVFCRGCDQILSQFAAIQSTGSGAAMSAPALQTEIDALRPVVVNWAWDSGGGHILLAYGMSGSNVWLMDPFYGPSISDYAWVNRGSGHTWQWTLRLCTSSVATNNVPRWWLGKYGLTNNWDAQALGDQDQDAVPTWKEYLADTIPTNGASFFGLKAMRTNGTVVVSWTSSTNRMYVIEGRSNLAQGTWTNLSSARIGTGGTMSVTNNCAGNMEYYRGNISFR